MPKPTINNGKQPPTARTAAQKKALTDAYAALASAFDDVLIVCSMRADHQAMGTDLDVYWQGGWPTASSLAEYSKQKIGYSRRPKNEPK
ncbi:MAG TPA: hypothetical protein VK615_01295 [Candidatus Binatia bacterium]|nr:hypothetical protein [Candidatus Binatia bacterium]